MLRDLVLYVPLAVWCNTAAGPLFDPVLVWYASRHPLPWAWVFVVLGTVAAGVGAAVEAGLLRRGAAAIGASPPTRQRWFYPMVFLIALSPAPFTLARAASLRHRPHPAPYAAAVAAGRLPRYAATVVLWNAFTPSLGGLSWEGPWMLAAAVSTAALVVLARGARRKPLLPPHSAL